MDDDSEYEKQMLIDEQEEKIQKEVERQKQILIEQQNEELRRQKEQFMAEKAVL